MPANLYYDDQKRLIATTDAELVIYFKCLPGVTSVQNLPFILNCPMVSLYQVSSAGVLPKFIYKNGLSPINKIFVASLQQNNISGLNSLCSGVSYDNVIPPPVVGTIFSSAIDYYFMPDGVTPYTLPDGVTQYIYV